MQRVETGTGTASAIVVDEPILSERPLVVRRRVKFGETDAAGVVYTGRFLDYALESVEIWSDRVVGLNWSKQEELGLGTPAVACQLEFFRPLRTGDRLDIEVRVDRIGGKSFTLRTIGRNAEGQDSFVAQLTFASIDLSDRTPVQIPEPYRSRMQAYVDAVSGQKKEV